MATLLISCGEASGEIYAAEVAEQVRRRRPDLRLVGVGGAVLARHLDEQWADLDELSVMGFAEVVRHLPRLHRLRERLAARARREGVDLLLAVDYPGFHVSLAGAMKQRGIPTLHYIPPKTWSWGAWRNRGLRAKVRRCAVIFPFEEAYYRQRGIPARFVGHPLMDRHAEALARPPGAREGLLLVPGSRAQEIQRIGPVMARAAARLRAEGRVGPVRVSRAPTVAEALLAPLRAELPDLQVVEGPLMDHLLQAAAAMVCSGTATVETALSRTPHAICYRTSPLTYLVARRLATVPAIGMANIVLGRKAFPELVQKDLGTRALAAAVAPLLLSDSPEVAAQRRAFDEVAEKLGRGEGAAANVAAMALEMLDGAEA